MPLTSAGWQIDGLESREVDNLSLFLKSRNESEPSYLTFVNITKKNKSQRRLLVVTLNRIYLMRPGCDKAERDGHLRDLKSLTSPKLGYIDLEARERTSQPLARFD